MGSRVDGGLGGRGEAQAEKVRLVCRHGMAWHGAALLGVTFRGGVWHLEFIQDQGSSCWEQNVRAQARAAKAG